MDADGSSPERVIASTSSDKEPSWQPLPVNGYPRPLSASPVKVSLAIAYDQCKTGNRTHGPPLVFDSCNPPVRSSQHLTVGTFNANGRNPHNEGSLRVRAIVGNPATPADEADVGIAVSVSDVLTGALVDYSGELRAAVPVRITDKSNTPHPGGPGAATVQDFTLAVDVPCAVVADPDEGSACQAATTVDALMPGAIREGRRSVWELGQVVVYDGGPDGDAATPDNTVFARQGIFIP
jgi:hypothetical protein